MFYAFFVFFRKKIKTRTKRVLFVFFILLVFCEHKIILKKENQMDHVFENCFCKHILTTQKHQMDHVSEHCYCYLNLVFLCSLCFTEQKKKLETKHVLLVFLVLLVF